MARRNRGDEERSMDSLMDAMTNVVGILLLILIVVSLGISQEVQKIIANIIDVSEPEYAQMQKSRDKIREDLQNLKNDFAKQEDNKFDPEEAKQLAANLDKLKEENKEIAERTSDILEWEKKVAEQETHEVTNNDNVLTADKEDRRLAAILAQTPEVEKKTPKVIKLPNPRPSTDRDTIHYLICKNEKLYYVGDPYDHVFKIRDVIDQNFTDLVYVYPDDTIGSPTHALKGTKRNDARNGFLPLTEDFRLTRSAAKDFITWTNLNTKSVDGAGKARPDQNVLKRLFGNEDKKEFPVHKFRYDKNKIAKFFGNGKLGPADFAYHISPVGDRLKVALALKPDGGWPREKLGEAGASFDTLCRTLQTQTGTVFYYMVASDSFETYLEARAKSETHRIKAGWTIWNGDKFEPKASILQTTARYNLDALNDAEYMKLANHIGPKLVKANTDEVNQFDARVNAAADAAVADESIKPGEKQEFVNKLGPERRSWNASNLQSWSMNPYRAALAASEASGPEEIQVEVHPPEIPHIRIFVPANPPSKPKPPPDPNKPKPKPKGSPKNTVILD